MTHSTLLAASLVLLAACGPPAEEPVAVDPLELVTSPGPFTPGYMERELTYTEPVSGEQRTLRLAIWYPSTETVGGEARYMGVFEAPGVLDEVTPAPSVTEVRRPMPCSA